MKDKTGEKLIDLARRSRATSREGKRKFARIGPHQCLASARHLSVPLFITDAAIIQPRHFFFRKLSPATCHPRRIKVRTPPQQATILGKHRLLSQLSIKTAVAERTASRFKTPKISVPCQTSRLPRGLLTDYRFAFRSVKN